MSVPFVMSISPPIFNRLRASSFTMYSYGYMAGTNPSCWPKLSQSLINQLRVSIGGQMISGGNCQEVGTLYNIGSRLQQGQPQTSMLRLQHLGSDCTLSTAVADTVYGALGATRKDPIVIDDWPFFMSSTPRYLHTGILPEMIVDIVLAPNSVLGGTDITYTLTDIYFTIEVIQFDNDLYSKIMETRLANGDTVMSTTFPFMFMDSPWG